MVQNKVSVKRVILDLVEKTSPDLISDMPLLVKWAIIADRKIGNYYDYVKSGIVLDIVNYKAALPIQAVAVLQLLLGKHDVSVSNNIFNQIVYPGDEPVFVYGYDCSGFGYWLNDTAVALAVKCLIPLRIKSFMQNPRKMI